MSAQSRRAEQRAQAAAVERIANRARDDLAREITRAMRAAGALVTRGEPMPATMVMAEHRAAITRILTALWTAAAMMNKARSF